MFRISSSVTRRFRASRTRPRPDRSLSALAAGRRRLFLFRLSRPFRGPFRAHAPAALLAAALALLPAGPAPAGADNAGADAPRPALDPQAVEILGRAVDFLAAQKTIRVDWFVSWDEVIDGREKITHLRSGSNLLDRERGFRSRAENGMETREYIFDGETIRIVDVEENAYAEAPAPGDFDDLVQALRTEYGIALPIWQILSRKSRAGLLDDAESGAYLGKTRIAGQVVHHLAFSDYDSDWQVWIAADPERPVPMMLVGTDPYTQGWPQYRAFFFNWDFSPEIDADSFRWEPDPDSERLAWPRIGRPAGKGETE